MKGCRPCRRPLTEETSQRSPLLSCWNFKKTTETDMILRCKGMCWEQCSQMCEAEWTHAEKSFMRGQTTASEPSLRFSYNSQLTLLLLSAVLYPKFEDISWDMWLFHSSDSSNHLPTERPSFCNWYGKYHPDTYTHGGWTQYTCFGHPAVRLRKFGGTCARGLEHWASRIEMSATKTSCFKRVIRDSLLRSKISLTFSTRWEPPSIEDCINSKADRVGLIQCMFGLLGRSGGKKLKSVVAWKTSWKHGSSNIF